MEKLICYLKLTSSKGSLPRLTAGGRSRISGKYITISFDNRSSSYIPESLNNLMIKNGHSNPELYYAEFSADFKQVDLVPTADPNAFMIYSIPAGCAITYRPIYEIIKSTAETTIRLGNASTTLFVEKYTLYRGTRPIVSFERKESTYTVITGGVRSNQKLSPTELYLRVHSVLTTGYRSQKGTNGQSFTPDKGELLRFGISTLDKWYGDMNYPKPAPKPIVVPPPPTNIIIVC